MKRLGWLALLMFCACGVPRYIPTASLQEAFPFRNQDPTLGIVVNIGTADVNLVIKDEAERIIEKTWLKGANPYIEINGHNLPNYLVRNYPLGRYRVEVWPFYYITGGNLLTGFYKTPATLKRRATRFTVDPDPTDNCANLYRWFGSYRLEQHHCEEVGWILRIRGGDVPERILGHKTEIRTNLW